MERDDRAGERELVLALPEQLPPAEVVEAQDAAAPGEQPPLERAQRLRHLVRRGLVHELQPRVRGAHAEREDDALRRRARHRVEVPRAARAQEHLGAVVVEHHRADVEQRNVLLHLIHRTIDSYS